MKTINSNSIIQVSLIAFCCMISFNLNAQISCKATCNQEKGWMPNGWGSYTITAKNESKDTIVLSGWEIHWKREKVGKIRKLDIKLAPLQEWKKTEIAYLSQSIIDNSRKKTPLMLGHISAKINGKEKDIPFKLAVPASYLPEPTRTIKEGNIGIELMQSRFDQFKNTDKVVTWMNQSYQAMEALTGGLPYDGARVIFKESVEHPYWAYAGQEIILNTKFVESTLKDFDNDLLSFGWVHEMGHDFDDGIGEWYIWSGPTAEFQANFKLCYAVETIKDQSFKMSQTVKVPDFPLTEKSKKVSGLEMSHKSFLFFGDKYLSDSERSWKTLSSDEMHSLFQRIQIMYGWDVYKTWYRTYRELKKKGFSPPESQEDKINLIVAILSKTCKVDLMPLFQTWRFPVSKEQIELIKEKYKLNQA